MARPKNTAVKTAIVESPFPVLRFPKLPKGLDTAGRAGRTHYGWDRLNPQEGIEVPRDKYAAASSSASNFAKNHPLDDKGRTVRFATMAKTDDDGVVIKEEVTNEDGTKSMLPVSYLIIRAKAAMPEKVN